MSGDVLVTLARANPVPAEDAVALDLDACLAEAAARGSSACSLPGPRARAARLRGLTLAAAAGLVAVASALAFGHPTIDFFKAKKAPGWKFVAFERQVKLSAFLSGLPQGTAMELAAPAREITDLKFDGHDHELVVAPLRNGGLCSSWSGALVGSMCGPARRHKPIQFGLSTNASGSLAVQGVVFPHDAQLRIRYQDGTTSEIPVVFVSPPIDAGFFLYPIGRAHRHAGHYPAGLELLDAGGKTIATVRLPHGALPPPQPVHATAGLGRIAVPRQAIYAKRRLLFEVTAAVPRRDGGTRRHRLGLWTAPARGGGTCLWGNVGPSGCARHPVSGHTPLPIEPNFYSDTLCCQVGAGVVRVELRFQDGARIELHAVDGYLLATVPVGHYRPGHRLTEEVAYDRAGRVLGTRAVSATQPGRYPCARPSVHVDGLTLCP